MFFAQIGLMMNSSSLQFFRPHSIGLMIQNTILTGKKTCFYTIQTLKNSTNSRMAHYVIYVMYELTKKGVYQLPVET